MLFLVGVIQLFLVFCLIKYSDGTFSSIVQTRSKLKTIQLFQKCFFFFRGMRWDDKVVFVKQIALVTVPIRYVTSSVNFNWRVYSWRSDNLLFVGISTVLHFTQENGKKVKHIWRWCPWKRATTVFYAHSINCFTSDELGCFKTNKSVHLEERWTLAEELLVYVRAKCI